MTKIAYWARGKRPASNLTYEQWCKKNDQREQRRSRVIIEKEADKYAPRGK